MGLWVPEPVPPQSANPPNKVNWRPVSSIDLEGVVAIEGIGMNRVKAFSAERFFQRHERVGSAAVTRRPARGRVKGPDLGPTPAPDPLK